MICTRRPLLVTLLVTAWGVGSAAAQTLTFTHQEFASHPGARGIAAADFDRNGWIDVAHANIGRNSVTVLLNRGDGSLVRSVDVPVGTGPFDLATGDFDRDGVPDLAVTNADAHTVSILRGRGTGAFARTDIPAPRGPRGIHAADVNRDGRLDLVVSGWEAGSVAVLSGNGSGGFSAGPALGGLVRPQGVAVADFNRDGFRDIAVAHADGVRVFSGSAGGAFTGRSIPGASGLNVLATADLDRDGSIDIAAASTAANRVAVFLNGGSGLRLDSTYPTGASPRDIVIADLNHDGMPDLATANRTAGTVSVLRGYGPAPGTFQPATDYDAGGGSRTLVADDLDRDGRTDLATGNEFASTFSVLLNATSFDRAGFSFRRLAFGTESNEMGGSNAIPADFNEDGKLDVVVRPSYELGPVLHVLLTDGPTVVLNRGQAWGYQVADVNSDGHADILTIRSNPFMAVLHAGDGHGGFRELPPWMLEGDFYFAGIGDVTGDGKLDVILSSWDRAIQRFVFRTMIGAGDGTFTPGASFGETVNLPGVQLVDVNRDGKVDATFYSERRMETWFGLGTGAFVRGWMVDVRLYPQYLTLAELNHDGYVDAVASAQDGLHVLAGSASGFVPGEPIRQHFGNWGQTVIADVTMDGNPDIVGSPGFIMAGRGDGTFEPMQRFAFDAPVVHAADFTRDGLPDLIYPTTNGAFEVLANARNSVNRAPRVDAGPDQTFEYTAQFDEEAPSAVALGVDPDAHALTYTWRDANGNIVPQAYQQYLPFEGYAHGTHTFTVTAEDGRGGSATDSVQITIVPTKEIVLWAASGFYDGRFVEIDDASAAGGVRGYDPNHDRPKVSAPEPYPASRISLGFLADPTQTYKLWVRLKADGNSWKNDSVWVQFTASTDAAGTPAFRTGTSSGLAISLEECLGCGVSGWGWADDGWGAPGTPGVMLRFTSVWQSIVIQTREDGVSIDQVVLSAEEYATEPPGPSKNDTTILPFTFWQMEG